MKSTQSTNASKQLINAIQLARIRVAKTENQLKSAREQARLAKRRRKEAKAAARRAKKELRLAKNEFAEAEKALVAAEEKFAAAVERAVQNRKLAQARLRAKAAAARAKKKHSPTSGVPPLPKPASGDRSSARKPVGPTTPTTLISRAPEPTTEPLISSVGATVGLPNPIASGSHPGVVGNQVGRTPEHTTLKPKT